MFQLPSFPKGSGPDPNLPIHRRCAQHVRCRIGPPASPLAIDEDQAAKALNFPRESGDRRVGRFLGAHVLIFDEEGGRARQRGAQKIFADPRAGDGAACALSAKVPAPMTAEIADASELLVDQAARRGRGGQIAVFVARDGADRAELPVVRLRMVEGDGLLLLHARELRDAMLGQKIIGLFK